MALGQPSKVLNACRQTSTAGKLTVFQQVQRAQPQQQTTVE